MYNCIYIYVYNLYVQVNLWFLKCKPEIYRTYIQVPRYCRERDRAEGVRVILVYIYIDAGRVR